MQTSMTLRWCVLLLCAAAVTELVAAVPDANFTSTVQRGSESDDVKVRSVLECVIAADWTCVQVKTVRALRLWLNIGTVEEVGEVQSEVESKQDGDEEEHEEHEDNEDEEDSSEEPSEDSDETSDEDEADEPVVSSGGGKIPGSSLLEQLADALVDGVSAIFLTDSDDESRTLALRGSRALDRALQQFSTTGRRKNKKGGGHGHGATELISVIMMLKSGLMAIGTGFSALIQVKSFGFTVLGLVMSAVRLFLQYKATTNPTPPPIIKIFQVHQTEHTETEVHHVAPELHDHGYIPHHSQSSDGFHHHHHLPADYAHDRAYVAQKPGGKKKQEQQPIILMPSRP